MRLHFQTLCVAVVLLSSVVQPGRARADDLKPLAVEYRRELAERILPYWYDTAVDWQGGGYRLADDAVSGLRAPDEKQIVSQARMVWTFSLVHRHGFSTPARDYLKAASHGVAFLRQRMKDSEHGGYFWSVHPDGRVRDDRKRLYGEAFVMYALVEYYRASADRTALDEAMQLYRDIQTHAHDAKNGGWLEHFERDWKPMPLKDPNAIVEVAGYKSANTHLHLMEALTELYAETRDASVKRSLVESLQINQKYFYPKDPALSAFHRRPDWKRVEDARSQGLSYGHNVEFAWLMVRAEEVLGRRPSWKHFHNELEHTLKYGTDHSMGGVYNKGVGNEPATDRDKVWWVQAEMIAALTDGLRNRPKDAAYQDALVKLFGFVKGHLADRRDGIWLDTVTADGRPKSTGKAHSWKANYHDVRGLLKFVEAFENAPSSAKK
jgi:mannobiose 2-epimerase